MRIERILCPTDLTAESEAALRYASTLARAYEAQLILMYCQPDSPDKSDATVPNAAELLEQTLRKQATMPQLDNWRWQSKDRQLRRPNGLHNQGSLALWR
jgi:nucleotide-binding universal stress UspA family protein